MRGFDYNRFNSKKRKRAPGEKRTTKDIILAILQWLVVTVILFAWWMFMFLLFSIFLLNIWHVTIKQIILYSAILTAVLSILYARQLFRGGVAR